MFVTCHACSFCGEDDVFCLAAGPGDQLQTDRTEAAWLCSRCVWRAGRGAAGREVRRGTMCATCGSTMGRRQVTVFRETFPGSTTARWSAHSRKPRAVWQAGERAFCHECLDEARRLLASPWIRTARARWASADILHDGPCAVVGCDGRRIMLLSDERFVDDSARRDRTWCGAGCRGEHRVEMLEPNATFQAGGPRP